MYLDHFGLTRQPFKITPDTSLFYKGSKRGAALEALKYAIVSGEGIIKVVGEVGSGKTMLCRMLEIELPDSIEIVYIAHPSLSPENILHVIAFELKLNITNESTRLEVMQQLQQYLVKKHAVGQQVVVFVEEAQGMPLETLEEIRLLSNLETNDHKLLQMVLFGQPELDEKLRTPSIRQLKERITHSFYLDPFPHDDIYDYLNFRMKAVGYRGPDIFSPQVARNIEKKSKGLTRRINILADKALMAVYSQGAHRVSSRHIALAARDSDFIVGRNWKPWIGSAGAVVALAVAVWAGTLLPIPVDLQVPVVIEPQQSDEQALAAITDEPVGNGPATRPPETAEQSASAGEIETPTGFQADSDAQSHNPVEPDSRQQAAGSLLERRVQKTGQWLANADPDNFTIQLILLDAWAQDRIDEYITDTADALGLENIYIYRAVIQGRQVYSVLYNDFDSRDAAVAGLRDMPDRLRANGAFLRTVKGIKSDITRREQLASSWNRE